MIIPLLTNLILPLATFSFQQASPIKKQLSGNVLAPVTSTPISATQAFMVLFHEYPATAGGLIQTPKEFFIEGKVQVAGSGPVTKLPAIVRSGALLNVNFPPVKVYVVPNSIVPDVIVPLVNVMELFPF